jgi:hypothetical protein
MQTKPWLPKELIQYERARKVLGVLAKGKPDAKMYRALFRKKVIDLISKAPDLYPIETELNLPLNYLNDPSDPEVVFLDLEDLAEGWRRPAHDLIMYLRGAAPVEDVAADLNLQAEEKAKPKDFRKELEDLTLAEFLHLATT